MNPMNARGQPRSGYSIIEATNWYSYTSNNPIKYVDPTGLTGKYNIDRESNTITVSVEIEIYGEAATDEIAQTYKKGIEDKWSKDSDGNPWKVEKDGEEYTIEFDITVTVGEEPNAEQKKTDSYTGTENFISAEADLKRSSVTAGYLGNWRSKGRKEANLTDDNPAPHEFGHLLGFKDRYNDDDGADKGWESNIMELLMAM